MSDYKLKEEKVFVCKTCGKDFYSRYTTRNPKWCSQKCRSIAWRKAHPEFYNDCMTCGAKCFGEICWSCRIKENKLQKHLRDLQKQETNKGGEQNDNDR